MDSTVGLMLTDDLQELNLDRPITAQKSSEELERLTVDEHLTDIERAVYLLSSGQEVQRISVITALPALLRNNNAECMRRVVPKLREVLYVAQQEMQMAASLSFLQILHEQLVPMQNYAQTFLQTILISIDNRDSDVSAAWLGTLLHAIELLPKDILKKDILGIAIQKGHLQQPVSVRVCCCKILGKLATQFDVALIKTEVMPVVLQLCQDVEHEVRASMCSQLDSVAVGLGLESTKTIIIPELIELSNDEERNVRTTGLKTIVGIVPVLDIETLKQIIVPLICQFCEKAFVSEDGNLPSVALNVGPLVHALQNYLNEDQKQWFVDFYKKMCRVGLNERRDKDGADWFAETRRNAAYNFPAIALMVGQRNVKAELLPILSAFCQDPRIVVRKTIANAFHEVVGLMSQHVASLFPEMIVLLKDESLEVLDGVVSNFSASCDMLMRHVTGCIADIKMSLVQDLVLAFLSAEVVIFTSNFWRLQRSMMIHVSCLAAFCPQEMLYSHAVPLLFDKMKNARALPVRKAAARSLLVIMRYLHKYAQRAEIMAVLIEDFCNGHSCHRRSLFIAVCRFFIELYSKAFFKAHLFEHVLSMISDPVPNIRLQICALLPSLKRLINLPNDNNLRSSLELCIRQVLVNEIERDVILAMERAVEELDQVHIPMESMVSRQVFEDDGDEQLKEREEKQLLEIEEQEKKEEENRREKKNSFSKRDGCRPSIVKKASVGKGSSVAVKGDAVRKDSKGSAPSSNVPAAPSMVMTCPVSRSKVSTSSHRPGSISLPVNVPQRKGSVGSLSSNSLVRRGSVGSASATICESSSGGRTLKTKLNSPSSSINSLPVSKGTRKTKP